MNTALLPTQKEQIYLILQGSEVYVNECKHEWMQFWSG